MKPTLELTEGGFVLEAIGTAEPANGSLRGGFALHETRGCPILAALFAARVGFPTA